MRTSPSSFFRKAIIPWYDSNAAIAVMIVVLNGVAVFAIMGIQVARHEDGWSGHIWVPVVLLTLCLLVMGMAIRRWASRHPSDSRP